MAARTFVRQRVRDYDAFRRSFDSGGSMRKAGGVLDEAVYRAEGDPQTVAIALQFSSLAQAHAFSESAALREAMNQAGVEEGSRRVEFYEET